MAFISFAIVIPTIVLASIALISAILFLRQQNVNFNNQIYQLTTTNTERYELTTTTESTAKNFLSGALQCNCQKLPDCPHYQSSMILDENQLLRRCGFDPTTFSIQICCPVVADIPEPRPTQAHQRPNDKPIQPPVIKMTSSTMKYDVNETAEEDYPILNVDIRTGKPKKPIFDNVLEDESNGKEDEEKTQEKPEDVTVQNDKIINDAESIVEQLSKNSNLRLHENFNLLPQSTEECGNSKNDPLLDIKKKRRKKRVVGGMKASLEKYSWLVKLYYNNTNRCESQMCFGCLGTVINNKYILTSAHCARIPTNPVFRLTIIAGDGETTKVYTVEKLIPHPDYDNLTKHHDIALIRIRENIIFGQIPKLPVCLPFFEAYNLNLEEELANNQNNEILVAGWGVSNSSDTSTIGKELRDAIVPEWPTSVCQDKYNQFNRNKTITSHQFCTGADKKTNADACWGDSGAGIYSLRSMIQVGIVSYGFPSPFKCGSFPGVNTRVIFYLKWILDSISP